MLIVNIVFILVLVSLVLGAFLLALRLAKRRAFGTLGTMALLVLGAIVFALRPVCYPFTDAEVAGFSPPIEERHETNFYGLRTFQQRDGQWYGCKMAIQYWLFLLTSRRAIVVRPLPVPASSPAAVVVAPEPPIQTG